MLDTIAQFATILAALLAATPLVAGATRGTRLRRSEQTLREAAAFTEHPGQKTALLSMHQQVVAHIVAAKLVPWWRLWLPVAGTVFFAALFVAVGTGLGAWLSVEGQRTFEAFLDSAFEGDVLTMVLYAFAPLLMAENVSRCVSVLKYRNRTALAYNTGTLPLNRYKPGSRLVRRNDEETAEGNRLFLWSALAALGISAVALTAGIIWRIPKSSRTGAPVQAFDPAVLGWVAVTASVAATLLLIAFAHLAGSIDDVAMPDAPFKRPHNPSGAVAMAR